MNSCIHCRAPLSDGARFCTRCGTQQPQGASTGPAFGSAPGPQPPLGHQPQGGSGSPTTVMITGSARLVIQDVGKPPREIPLSNTPLTIGRAPENNIVIDSRFVSKSHARIEPEGLGHTIVDVGSTNGLLFNGQRISGKTLLDGDVLRIGDPITGNFVTLTYLNPALRQSTAEVLTIGRFNLQAPVVRIGREGNDLNLPNPQVSRRHAEIIAVGDGHQIRDLHSTNGTFVNGQRVTTQLLKRGDVIQIGPFKLVYNETSLDQFDQRGAMRIDARSLVRIVGNGKVILNDVTIVIEPREFVALVGGSGAGKSTLLGALSGFARATRGMVLVNGDDYYRNFDAYRTVLGYVPQDDILHRALPVDRALRYAAKLRLPDDTSEAEIENRIGRVLEDVEMGPHRQKRVENLSGGQRKRVSIASELLADPSLFFLDEPTSGLDPGLEKKMMYTLRQLADSGRTIVLVTHATANIKLCDHVAFMAEGRLVFFGPPNEALEFFNITSGDFADIYNKLEGPASEDNPVVRGELRNEYAFWRQLNPQAQQPPMLAELWEIRYRHSDTYRIYIQSRVEKNSSLPAVTPVQPAPPAPMLGQMHIAAPPVPASPMSGPLATRPKQPPVSSFRQFKILTQRYFDLVAADRKNLAILLLQAPIIGLLMLLVAKADDFSNPAQHGRLTAFILTTVAVWFGILNSAREITKESPIYKRERLANLRIGPYVGSKVAVLSGLCLIQAVVLMLVLSIKVDFTAPTGLFVGLFSGFLITTFLTALTGMALGLAISASVTSPDKAMSIIPFALIPQIIFALAIVPLPKPLVPIAMLASSKWALEAYGSIAGLPEPVEFNIQTRTQTPFPGVSYEPTNNHVLMLWIILLVYSAALIGLTAWLLKRRDQQV
ncbi:MAG: ABC transporter ATP-binding protein [Herpetosiphonaceae bacterium]|nr:MAG: ABC transporter ATP-binding protein [Herpetosiphonaceae bacterium]